MLGLCKLIRNRIVELRSSHDGARFADPGADQLIWVLRGNECKERERKER